MESVDAGAFQRLKGTLVLHDFARLVSVFARLVSIGRQNRWAWALIGLWALAMMSLPIVLWTVGDGLLPIAVTVTTSLQAAAVIVVLGTAWGWRRTIASVMTIAVLGWLVEYVGSTTGIPFGAYTYTARLQPQLSGVPLLIPVAWFVLLPCAWTVAGYMAGGGGLFVALGFGIRGWDLFLEPQIVTCGRWDTSVSRSICGLDVGSADDDTPCATARETCGVTAGDLRADVVF